MIMIIAIIYISKVHSPLKIQKVQVPPFLPTLKIFQPPPLSPSERGQGRALVTVPYSESQASSKVCQTCMMIMHIQRPSIVRTVYPSILKDIQGYI